MANNTTVPSGYVNGSDVLIKVAGEAVDHCTSHQLTWNAETKERSVKPAFSAAADAGLWAIKNVNKLSAQISFEGLRFYGEQENGYQALLATMAAHTPVEVSAYERGKNAPYATGQFVLTSLEESNPAGDDATYSGQLESTGAVTITPANLTTGTPAA